jgi:hypothetical protein
VSDDRAQLTDAVDRLEVITTRLGEGDLGQDDLKQLADEALAVSARVSELLPRIIREIERASEGSVQTDAEPSQK